MIEATFIDMLTGRRVGHFTAPDEASVVANLPEGCDWLDGHLPLPSAPDDRAARKRRAIQHEIDALERQQQRAMRELAIWGQDARPEVMIKAQAARQRLLEIDAAIAALRQDF